MKRKICLPSFLICSVVAGLAGFQAQALEPSILVNGSFESPPGILFYETFGAGPTIPGWVIQSGTVDIVGPYWQAAAGVQSLDLNGVFDEIGTIYQDVPTVPGQLYLVSFAYAGNPDGEIPVIKSANVFWNDGLLANLSFDITGHTHENMGWTSAQYTVAASSANTRLLFQSTSPTFCGLTLDDISVVAVPEPSVAALLGFGLAGSLLRRSKGRKK